MVFVDFSKAFDTVGRTGLWKLLRKYECTETFRTMIETLHTGIMANVSVEGKSRNRITRMDKLTNKDVLERTGLPSMEVLQIRKNLRWTGHLMRMSPDRLPKQILYFQERAPSSPVQGYHQEKPEAERHKDRPMDITLTAERSVESNSQVIEAVFVASRPTA